MSKRLSVQLAWFLFQILTCALLIGHSSAAHGAVSGSSAVATMPSAQRAPSSLRFSLCGDMQTTPITTWP